MSLIRVHSMLSWVVEHEMNGILIRLLKWSFFYWVFWLYLSDFEEFILIALSRLKFFVSFSDSHDKKLIELKKYFKNLCAILYHLSNETENEIAAWTFVIKQKNVNCPLGIKYVPCWCILSFRLTSSCFITPQKATNDKTEEKTKWRVSLRYTKYTFSKANLFLQPNKN